MFEATITIQLISSYVKTLFFLKKNLEKIPDRYKFKHFRSLNLKYGSRTRVVKYLCQRGEEFLNEISDYFTFSQPLLFQGILPLKWMAVEAIKDLVFNEKTDV